jgi:hypothetical protein
LAEEYPAAIAGALDETSLPDGAFMTTRPYSAEQLQDQDLLRIDGRTRFAHPQGKRTPAVPRRQP